MSSPKSQTHDLLHEFLFQNKKVLLRENARGVPTAVHSFHGLLCLGGGTPVPPGWGPLGYKARGWEWTWNQRLAPPPTEGTWNQTGMGHGTRYWATWNYTEMLRARVFSLE